MLLVGPGIADRPGILSAVTRVQHDEREGGAGTERGRTGERETVWACGDPA